MNCMNIKLTTFIVLILNITDENCKIRQMTFYGAMLSAKHHSKILFNTNLFDNISLIIF